MEIIGQHLLHFLQMFEVHRFNGAAASVEWGNCGDVALLPQ